MKVGKKHLQHKTIRDATGAEAENEQLKLLVTDLALVAHILKNDRYRTELKKGYITMNALKTTEYAGYP